MRHAFVVVLIIVLLVEVGCSNTFGVGEQILSTARVPATETLAEIPATTRSQKGVFMSAAVGEASTDAADVTGGRGSVPFWETLKAAVEWAGKATASRLGGWREPTPIVIETGTVNASNGDDIDDTGEP